MFRSIAFRLLGTSLFAASIAFAGDDLFSDLQVESVYGASGSAIGVSPASTTPPIARGSDDSPVEIAGQASLAEALRKAGFDPKEANSRYLSVEVASEKTKRTAFASVSEDRRRVRLVAPLSTLAKGATLSSDRLATLLDANRADRDERFAFSAALGRIELHRSVENRDMTAAKLRDALDAMVAVADETESLWQAEETKAPAPAANAAGSSSPVGSWTASRSKTQAFALRLEADGKFALVTVDGARNVQSSGTYVLDGDQLSLNDAKGGALAGTIAMRSPDTLEFTPQGGAAEALIFRRAK